MTVDVIYVMKMRDTKTMKKTGSRFCLFSMIVLLAACGGIRYAQVNPEARDFHPRTLAILPVDVRTSYEATGLADEILTRVLRKTGKYPKVISPAEIRDRMEKDPAVSKDIFDYVAKFRAVNFSDPTLTRAIGKHFEVEAILLSTVDSWNYTMEGEDKVAKVGFAVDLIDTATGRVAWKAAHHETKTYWLIKPALPDLAESVAGMIVAEMPR